MTSVPPPAPAPAADAPQFDTSFTSAPGVLEPVAPGLRRMVAANPGPFTFRGTCTYVVGSGTVAIVDPGPEDAAHVAALQHSLRGETVSHILVTHTHRDHSPAAVALAAATGAVIAGCDIYRPRPSVGEAAVGQGLDASHDRAYAPDQVMRHGDVLAGAGWTLEAVATPGHAANHLCFAFREGDALLSGDHVMAWSTTVVAPPDGSMADYMRSLEVVRLRGESTFWPGHGGPVREPQRFVRGLATHRRQREAAILKRLAAGDSTIAAIVPVLYAGVPPALHGAAGLSVLAHLEDLVARGLVRVEGAFGRDGLFTLA